MGLDSNGNIKARHEWVRLEDWDLVIFDEYHFGAWRDSARKLFASINEDDEEIIYVAVKLNAKDSEKQFTLVDLDSITEATILGYADYAYLKNKCRVKNFGEGDAVFLEYNKLMRIDLLLTKFA